MAQPVPSGAAVGPAMPNPLGLAVHHVTMGVASIAAERAFYRDVLGFDVGPLRQRPTYQIQQMMIPGFRFDMIEQKGSIRPATKMGTDRQGWLHVSFTVANAGRLFQALKSKGITVAPGRMTGDHIGAVFVTDPEGNRIELAEPEG